MYNIIPLIIILISFSIIIAIVARKFSILANLDIDSIQSEREAKFKEQIISNRLKRNYLFYYSRLLRQIKPLGQALNGLFHSLYKKLIDFKESYKEEKAAENFNETSIEKLFLEAEELLKQDAVDEAESKYIKIISLDSKNTKAFRYLGELYYERKDYHEAKQTTLHAIRLLEKDYDDMAVSSPKDGEGQNDSERRLEVNQQLAGSYFDVALIAKAMENYEEAVMYIDKALAVEANSPRFLDTKLEISIIKKDKAMALETLEKLREVNPENGKLEELESAVRAIEN